MSKDYVTKILIADRDRYLMGLLQTNLKEWGFEVVYASNESEARQILSQKHSPQLAVFDFTIATSMDAIDICRQISEKEHGVYKYIIVLVNEENQEDVLYSMDFGPDDYLIKPFNIHEFHFRLNTAQRIIRFQEDLIRERENLKKMSMHDSLTRLYNRAAIMDFYLRELSRCQRRNSFLSLFMVDIDYFKSINDSHGHLAGDAVLREAAHRISDSLRRYDAVGRYGGEEFLVIVPHCDQLQAKQLAERIRTRVSSKPFMIEKKEIFVTISIGVSACQGRNDSTPEKLIQLADQALYAAKNSGRNRVELSKAVLGA
ncbi:MAG: diguanylate cyclase [Candidatus Omnitrophica bacterium]|nr:diguanylate cyclase [Candidatus Omnitrophota bacterium]